MDNAEASLSGTAGPPPRRRRWLLTAAAAVVAAVGVVIALVATGQPGQGTASAAQARTSPVQARNFSLPALGHSGQRVSLAAYAGQPVMVNFFASWCSPCKRETPLLARFYRAHHGKIIVLGIDSNDQAGPALKFLAKEGVSYPVGFDAYPASTAASYGIVALPQTFFLNARHQIVRHVSGDVTPAELAAWAATVTGKKAG